MQGLIQRLHENEEAAFEEIYYLLHQKIYSFIFRYLRDDAHAQELTQRFFIRLWDKRQRLSPDKPLDAQAFVIARNLMIDEWRKMAREKRLRERFRTWQSPSYSSTEEVVLLNELQDCLNEAVASLPQRRREIYTLSRQQGLTYREIAARLSISTKTVEAQMSKALKMVRTKLSTFLHILL